ncbi:MAG: sigma 54-interacting transcriptional regulator [Acidobacteriota bacterium]
MTRCRSLWPYALRNLTAGNDQLFVLSSGTNRIGSLGDNEIQLGDDGVSKRHAVLEVDGGTLMIRDLRSKNGTFVDGRRTSGAPVDVGSTLRFGRLELRLERLERLDGELALPLPPVTAPRCRVTPALDRPSSVPETRPLSPDSPFELDDRLVVPEGHVRGRSAPMVAAYRQLATVAASDLPVLLLGETGVGKEGLARAVHLSSPRASGPFVAVNCAAIPADLLEAELFGIAKGVATGVDARIGKLGRASGGTLFLDEIGDMPAPLQAKLLRALQDREIEPLGSTPRSVDVRVVAATNTDLPSRVASGVFRRDLYYRLAGMTVEVPPLRRRTDDLADLVARFARDAAAGPGPAPSGFTAGALRALEAHPWPGNVRQLEHAVRRLVLETPGGQPVASGAVDRCLAQDAQLEGNMGVDDRGVLDASRLRRLDLAEVEQRLVEEALERTGGNQSHAAPLLGISREALRRRMARYGLLGG